MPSPLPAPYIDCNLPASYTFRAALQLAINWPARGWEFDGGEGAGWYCPDGAARRRETGRKEVGA